MEEREERAITIIAIILLCMAVVLLFVVFLMIPGSYSAKPTGEVTVVNLPSPNYVKDYDYSKNYEYPKGYDYLKSSYYSEGSCDKMKVPYRVRVPYDTSYYEEYSRDVDYSSRSSTERVEGLLGNDIDKYTVYIENEEHEPRYFQVRFIFEDYYGEEHSYLISKYVMAGKVEEFVYKDIYADRDKHHRFRYKVLDVHDSDERERVRTSYRWETRYRWERVC
jgi:hypothetical protein